MLSSYSTADSGKIKHSPWSESVDICSANFYQLQRQIVWNVLSEEDTICHHVFLCVFIFSYSRPAIYYTSNSWFLSLLLPYLYFCGSLCHSLSLYLFSERHIGCLCCPFLCWPKSLKSHSTGRPCQEDHSLYRLCACEREYAWMSVSVHTVHILVCAEVCAFVCGVGLAFPALGMFKASSCAVRMCLSLFSTNTCSAFYQRAELGRPGAVQGWARIIKHQQILIHPDWNWLGLFAEPGLVGFGWSRWDNCISVWRIGATHGLQPVCGQMKLVLVLN